MLLVVVFMFNAFILLYLCLPFLLEKFPRYYYSFVFKPCDVWGNKEEHFTCFELHRLSSKSTRNFYVRTLDSNDSIGVWHILPYESGLCLTDAVSSPDFDKSLCSGKPVFIYFHGNTKTRSVTWRVDIYKLLSSLGYNVIAFDYRGYGDSSGKMTGENDCICDSLAVIRFVQERCGSSPLFFWGHSLGTGVVGSVMRRLMTDIKHSSTDLRLPDGIVLDAPFTSLAQVMVSRKTLWPYRVVPLLTRKVATLTSNLRVEFNTQKNLSDCPVPILIMHAKDDRLVPFKLGQSLAANLSSHGNVRFIPFESKLAYGHNFIHTAPEMPKIIEDFVASALNANNKS